MSVSVCLSVCPHAYLRNHHTSEQRQVFCTPLPEAQRVHFREISVHVACGRGSDLLWRRCGALCTSGFADDAMFPNILLAIRV